MEDLQPADLDTSTTIDTEVDGVRSGGGKPAVEPTPAPKPDVAAKKESVRDSLEAEAKKLNAKEAEPKPAKADAPDANEDTPDETADTKPPAPKADGSEQEAKTPKPSEGRKTIEAPARFLPRAKELWRNVPNEVRTEWQRAETEREAEIGQYREAKTFKDDLAEYDTMAKNSGTTVKEAFGKYVNMEKILRNDPTTGFRELMNNMNMHPVQAIAHIMKAANFTPQQLAEHMQREPDVYSGLTQARQQMQQPAQQERQPDPEVQSLKQEVEAMRAERVANDVIRPFADEYPEYYDNEQAIAKVLQSGIIDQIHGTGLGPRDKLEAALFMVAPGIRRSNVQADNDEITVPGTRETSPAVDLRGGKSVKSSIGTVTETVEPDRKMSMRDMLEEEAKKISRRA